MSTNKPMFDPVVLELGCENFDKDTSSLMTPVTRQVGYTYSSDHMRMHIGISGTFTAHTDFLSEKNTKIKLNQ